MFARIRNLVVNIGEPWSRRLRRIEGAAEACLQRLGAAASVRAQRVVDGEAGALPRLLLVLEGYFPANAVQADYLREQMCHCINRALGYALQEDQLLLAFVGGSGARPQAPAQGGTPQRRAVAEADDSALQVSELQDEDWDSYAPTDFGNIPPDRPPSR